MRKSLLLVLFASVCIVVFAGADRYLFIRRITHFDAKTLYPQIQRLIAAKDEQNRNEAILAAASSPEFNHYHIALVADHIVLLHTQSCTSEAYLAFQQLGDTNVWTVDWLRKGKYWQIGTDRF